MMLLTLLLCGFNAAYAQHFWHSWAGIEKMFVFGASYAATGFRASGIQPNAAAGRPFGNPPGYGHTSSGGPCWAQYLATTYNRSLIDVYNFGVGGAFIDSDIYHNHPPNDFVTQAGKNWVGAYGTQEDNSIGWTSTNALFAIFFAINDVDHNYEKPVNPSPEVFASYMKTLRNLYDHGARNFLILNAPPISRSPEHNIMSRHRISRLASTVLDWNIRTNSLASAFREAYPEARVFLYDVHAITNRVLDDPTSNPLTAGIKNTTGFCAPYDAQTKKTPVLRDGFKLPECEYKAAEYFWLNEGHPTWPVHELYAQQIAGMMSAAIF
ncbi:MAG: hypothetical protein Q9174_004809 [Haloplaca sp. 1 TL-2023]